MVLGGMGGSHDWSQRRGLGLMSKPRRGRGVLLVVLRVRGGSYSVADEEKIPVQSLPVFTQKLKLARVWGTSFLPVCRGKIFLSGFSF